MTRKGSPCKVSVSIITYNQAEYIHNAVNGALGQEVDFPYEIIIGDDCSTDGTREILRDYKQKHPHLIKLILHDTHHDGIAGRVNNVTNIRAARGQYIAFCDGDDYWTSKDKLQKQADFMDANPGYSFCFHDCLMVSELDKSACYMSDKSIVLRKDKTFAIKDLMKQSFSVGASTTFFRKCYFDPLPEWFWNVYSADRMLQLIAAKHGPIRYLKGINAKRVKNIHSVSRKYAEDGMFVKIRKNDIAIIKQNFDKKFGQPISFKAQYYIHQALKKFWEKKYFQMVGALTKAFFEDWRSIKRLLKRRVSTLRFLLIQRLR